MEIKKVVVKGFGKYEDKQVWKVEPGLTIVSGRNGTGKSTLYLESIAWALYGDTFRSARADDVVNDKTGKCMVKLVTDVGDIKRVKEAGKGSVVYVNDNPVSDNKIVELAGMDKKMFFNSVAFGNGVSGFLHLSSNDRRQMLNMTFEAVDGVIEKIKINKTKFNLDVSDVEGKLKELRGELEHANLVISNFVDRSDKLEELKKAKKKVDSELELLGKEINEKIEGIKRFTLDKDYQVVVNKLKEREKELIYSRANLISDRKNIVSRYEKLLQYDECPTCERVIDAKYKKEISKKIKTESERIDSELNDIERKIKVLEDRIKQAENEVIKVEKRKMELMRKLESLRVEEDKKRRKLAELNADILRYEREQVEYEKLKEDIEKKKELIAKLEKELHEKLMYVEGHDFWIRKLTDYKMMLFDMLINDFEPVANRFLSVLSNGRFGMKFSSGVRGMKKVSEVYDVEVYDRGKRVDFNRLSNGERRMITLGVNMCFQYLMTKYFAQNWNLVVFDEVFDGLDRVVRERVVDLLLDFIKETNKSVVVITHDDFSYRAGEWLAVSI
jgi:DNA repair exonuclease SbcCD ATPase subunit